MFEETSNGGDRAAIIRALAILLAIGEVRPVVDSEADAS
jgi:hypothetical protein